MPTDMMRSQRNAQSKSILPRHKPGLARRVSATANDLSASICAYLRASALKFGPIERTIRRTVPEARGPQTDSGSNAIAHHRPGTGDASRFIVRLTAGMVPAKHRVCYAMILDTHAKQIHGDHRLRHKRR
jgi:hypothetical protein